MRIVKEILENARSKVGDAYPLLVRVSAEEYFPEGGYHLNEGIEICRAVASYGADAINVTAAGNGCRYGQSLEPASFRQGWRKHLAGAVQQFVNIPVIGVSVLREPAYAQRMIEEGYMDFVGSARNYIADPEWANKAFEGREHEICHCISCLRCIQGVVAGESISCSVNPLCGRETLSDIPHTGDGRTVLVLGGGPAGMTAALQAVKLGFEVELYEASDALGGQLRLASKAPRKDKIGRYLSYLEDALTRGRVRVHLGTRLSPEEIAEKNAYGVIDATGAVPVVPRAFQGHEGYVVTPDQVLRGEVRLSDQFVVIVGSGMTGLETAEYLTECGNTVMIVEMADKIAPTAYGTQVRDITKYLDPAGTTYLTSMALNTVEDGYTPSGASRPVKSPRFPQTVWCFRWVSVRWSPMRPCLHHLLCDISKSETR